MKTFQQFAEELEPNQPTFSVSDIGATLRKIEAANEKERGRYTGLLNIIKSRPGMIELFGELINSLAGTTASTGQRLTNRLQ
jgi:hypothetical protein